MNEPPIEVATSPGLFSLLGEQESLDELRRFTASTGIELPLVPRTRSVTRGPANLVARIKQFFSAARVLDAFEQDFPIGIHQIHCPRTAGASGKLKVMSGRTKSASCSVTIFGLGGSDAATLTLEAEDSFESEATCRELVHSFTARWEHCEIAGADARWRQFVRLKEIIPRRTKVWVREVADDACARPPAEPFEQETFDLTTPGSVPVVRTLKVKESNKWTAGSQLEFPKVGLKLSSEMQFTRNFETAWEYRLPVGGVYVAWRTADMPAWLWRPGGMLSYAEPCGPSST
jgi:hypothetical protein